MNFLFGLLLVNFLGIITQVRAADSNLCKSAVSKYFECKYLKMKVNSTGHYISDWTVYDNYVTYLFYISTLDNITLSRALDLQRDIYLASQCSNTFCRCVRQATDRGGDLNNTNYGFAFRDENIYVQLKQAIVDYANEYGVSNETLSMRNNKSLGSIQKFCSSYNILTDGLNAITNINLSPCLASSLPNQSDYSEQDCLFQDADQLSFRALTDLYNEGYRISKSDEEKVVVCILKRLDFDKTCTPTEKRFTLTGLAAIHKGLLTGETSLDAFVDSMSRQVAEKKFTARNKSGSIESSYSFQIKTFDGNEISEFSGSRNVSLFASPFFNITVHLEQKQKQRYYYTSGTTQLKSLTISSMFNSSMPQFAFNRTFHFVPNSNQLSSDNSIMNPIDASEKTWIRWIDYQGRRIIWNPSRYLEFYDFKWNISISFKYGTLDVRMPESVANRAQGGVLVTGHL